MTTTKNVKSTLQMTPAEFRRYDGVVEHGKEDFVAISKAWQFVQKNWDKYIKVGDALEKIRDGEGWRHLTGCTGFGDCIEHDPLRHRH